VNAGYSIVHGGVSPACILISLEEKLMKAVRMISMLLVLVTAALAGCQSGGMSGDSSSGGSSGSSAGGSGGY
jgi:hypothetical protein